MRRLGRRGRESAARSWIQEGWLGSSAGRDQAPQALTILAEEIRRLDRSVLPLVAGPAEHLMIRYYRRIEPAEQLAVRNAMAWLTATVLLDLSA
jgi:hypothetical protein